MTQERIQAYEMIKYALTDGQLLLMQDWKLPIKLYIDACGEIVGAALNQFQIALKKPYYHLHDSVFEVITDCNTVKSLININTPNRHMLRWQIAIQEYRGNRTVARKDRSINKNADFLSIWALSNTTYNPSYVSENSEPQIPIKRISITDIGT
ncbi:hypothetical protein O181_002952 [Austropuccinia psidii MF-1]|uniref:Reverse transcriptase RNase H-like domain-containing protein n=1 Tax=Austropuccinia psidii MF-1 TaxID=1389203 RepID=A0A9Q3BDF7_9BASI|nr:hypothetical protein [Austropuccinia psidii MF-1]